MSKGWTPERRAAQAERCRKNKPWEQSTGPKTAAGKAKSSMNAFKHGGDTRIKNITRDILKHNRAFLESCREFELIKLIKILEKQASIPPKAAKFEKTK